MTIDELNLIRSQIEKLRKIVLCRLSNARNSIEIQFYKDEISDCKNCINIIEYCVAYEELQQVKTDLQLAYEKSYNALGNHISNTSKEK